MCASEIMEYLRSIVQTMHGWLDSQMVVNQHSGERGIPVFQDNREIYRIIQCQDRREQFLMISVKKLPSWRHTIQVRNCLFCAIQIVGKKYDISVETMEIFHILLWPLQQKTRENLLVADFLRRART